MDRAWWDKYIAEVDAVFSGRRFSAVKNCHGAEHSNAHHYQNSGAAAVSLAHSMGVKKIILLGFDCQHSDGKTHWHGDHPKGLGNAGKVKSWPAKFAELAKKTHRISVVNCSRKTALTCWPRKELSEVLCE